MIFVLTRMVRHYEQLGIYLTHHFEVPVIVVFTKFDQFLRNVEMHLVDYPDEHPPDSKVSDVAEEQFQKHYLHSLRNAVTFVRLESGFGATCRGYKLTLQCC